VEEEEEEAMGGSRGCLGGQWLQRKRGQRGALAGVRGVGEEPHSSSIVNRHNLTSDTLALSLSRDGAALHF
jgi:hypothetical protein